MYVLPPPQVLAEALLLLPPSVDRQVALFSFGPDDYLEGKDVGMMMVVMVVAMVNPWMMVMMMALVVMVIIDYLL